MFWKKLIASTSLLVFTMAEIHAAPSLQTMPIQMAQAPAAPPATTATAPQTMPLFSKDELKNLLSPIALYPDPLLAQLLPASTYPLEIVQLARWLEKNKDAVAKQDFSALDTQNWDPTVKALGRFPSIVQKMNENLDWTNELGEAFIEQPNDVADVIQDLRALAQKSGALTTTPQQTVTTSQVNNRDVIVIEPSAPDQIYVPTYTEAVYNPVGSAVAAGLLTFGTAVAVGAIVNNSSWNWGTGVVYPPVWGGYRPGRPIVTGDVNIGSGNIGVGNNINHSNIIGNTKPWRPDPNRRTNLQNRAAGAGIDRTTLTNRSVNVDRSSGLSNVNLQNLQRPQARPAQMPQIQRPRDTAFSGIDRGQASAAFANRGAQSRGQIARPAGGGGGRAAIHAGGGGGRGPAARGGGGRRR